MWLTNLSRIISFNGGLLRSLMVLTKTDDLKMGKFKGTDEMGNRYYENDYYFFPRNRWVIYSNKFGYDYDASYIPPAWFRWIHNMTDETPIEENRCVYHWMLPYEGNQTGTNNEYVPYSTTNPRITPWVPPSPVCKLDKTK